MQINLTKAQIESLAQRRDDGLKDGLGVELDLMKKMRRAAKRKHMTRGDLTAVARWKWRGGRLRRLCQENTELEVKEISAVSFAAKSERLRIGALLALRGVQWPMASVILHFACKDKYPILDVRAMKAVGGSTIYTFENWREYVGLCRATAAKHDIEMRTLDKALWQAGKELQ